MANTFFLKLKSWLFPAAIIAYFVFYLLAFPVPAHLQEKRFAVGDDFEYVSTLQGEIVPRLDRIEDPGDVKKHPLFPLIAVPLYRLGLWLFSSTPLQKNLALGFPFALMGLINLIISYRIFKAVFEKRGSGLSAKMLTLLYGACFSCWIFSSNVETYIMTTLFQNLFFWYCFARASTSPSVFALGGLLSLSILSSTAMAWLLIPSWVVLYCRRKNIGEALLKSLGVFIVTCLATGAIYVFYDLYYQAHAMPAEGGFGPRAMLFFSVEYLNRWLRWDPNNFVLLVRAFFIDSIVYTRLSRHMLPLVTFWAVGGVFFMVSVLSLWRERFRLPSVFSALASFVAAYAAFFCFFSPESCILYSLPALLPLLIILFLGFSLSTFRIQKPAFIALLTLVILINNVDTYLAILKFKNFNLKVFQYAQVGKLSYEQTLSQFGGR